MIGLSFKSMTTEEHNMSNFDKLNRLRVNAGKPELKSWKASQDKLSDAIKTLETAGFTDVLPGAVNTTPKTDDPEIAQALTADHPMMKNMDNSTKTPPAAKKEATKVRGMLARGLDTDSYARHSREKVQDLRRAEKKAKEASDPKKTKKIAGKIDEKKDPAKAARQKKHVEDKQKARAAAPPAKEKNPNEITVADICRELDIDPKVGRAKLRRHEAKLAHFKTKGQDRWTFPIKAGDEIRKILKGSK
jgi:hypothetical protein